MLAVSSEIVNCVLLLVPDQTVVNLWTNFDSVHFYRLNMKSKSELNLDCTMDEREGKRDSRREH